jgi:hypothetical protein
MTQAELWCVDCSGRAALIEFSRLSRIANGVKCELRGQRCAENMRE